MNAVAFFGRRACITTRNGKRKEGWIQTAPGDLVGGDYGGFWWQPCRDEGFDLVPDARIVFDLDVRAHEEAGVPGEVGAIDVFIFVVKLIVP